MPKAHFVATPTRGVTEYTAPDTWDQVVGLPPHALAAVYGAPGVGKTTLLRKRFTSLVLDVGIRPEQILVITATRESAAALRDDLLFDLAQGGLSAVSGESQVHPDDQGYAVEGSLARTVASLAFAVVRHHALANGLRQPELVSGPEQDAIFLELLNGPAGEVAEGLWPVHIGAVTRGLSGFRAELRDLVTCCQEHGLSSAELGDLSPKRQEWAAASVIFAAYEEHLAKPENQNRFDSSGLLNRAIELLREPEISEYLPAFKAILVDDAQELTPSASRLLSALVTESTGLICFGDPDSSTLGFRQADPRLMGKTVSALSQSQERSLSEIVLAEMPWARPNGLPKVLAKVSSLIGVVGPGRQRVVHSQLSAGTSGEAPDSLVAKVLSSQQGEVEWLAHQLRSFHLLQGISWAQMAVVARTRTQLAQLERALATQSVPVRIAGSQSALRDEFAARELLEIAGFVCRGVQPNAEEAERLLRSPFCGLDSLGMRRLRRALRREELAATDASGVARNSDELILEFFKNPAALETLRGAEAAKVRSFLRSLAKAGQLMSEAEATVEDLLWELWHNSGLEKAWSEASKGVGEIALQANRNLDAIVALFAAANRFVERNPSGSAEAFIQSQLQQALPEDTLARGANSQQFVTLTTPAGLVGRRFEIVSIPQLIEGVWPNLKPRNSLLGANLIPQFLAGAGAEVRQELSDELRMFYKAVGAANGRVLVSSYLDPDEQVSQFVAHAAGGDIPSEEDFRDNALTLRGMAGALRRRLALSVDPEVRAKTAVDLGRLAAAGVPGAHPDEWYGLSELSIDEPLFEFVTEAVEPGASDDQHDRGARITINPSQLEAFVKCPLHWFLNYHGAAGSDFSASVGTLVHRALELATTTSEAELWSHVESGWHSLRFETEWLEQAERRRAQKLVANLAKYLTEFDASGGKVVAREQEFEFDLGLAHIRGKVDRIEQLGDGSVLIVDLKTGKTVPSVAEAGQNPQLGLYQLAYESGAFKEALLVGEQTEAEVDLAGAKLLLVSGDSPTIRSQESLQKNRELASYFEGLIQDSAAGMAMPDRVFVARVSNHCEAENEFGTCHLHLTKAVSYVD